MLLELRNVFFEHQICHLACLKTVKYFTIFVGVSALIGFVCAVCRRYMASLFLFIAFFSFFLVANVSPYILAHLLIGTLDFPPTMNQWMSHTCDGTSSVL